MQKPFYREGLLKGGIETVVPDMSSQQKVHEIIFEELGKGIISENSKQVYLKIIDDLAQQGAEGVILGCTEIPLLIKAEDCGLPLFDTAELHAKAALLAALA
jgi:aspartate racemase